MPVDRQRIGRCLEAGARIVAEIGDAVERGPRNQGRSAHGGVAGRGKIGREEKGQRYSTRQEVEAAFDERHGEIGQVPPSRSGTAPPAVAVCQGITGGLRQFLRANPGWVADHEVESATTRGDRRKRGADRKWSRCRIANKPSALGT